MSNGKLKARSITDRVNCPFFSSHSAATIRCESIVPNGRINTVSFSSQNMKMSHMTAYCYKVDGNGCAIYEALMKKYE